MASAVSSVRLLILMPINTQIITSSPGEEDWVPSNAGSKEGHRFKVLAAPR